MPKGNKNRGDSADQLSSNTTGNSISRLSGELVDLCSRPAPINRDDMIAEMESIDKIVKEIRSMQQSKLHNLTPRVDCVAALEKWATERGITFSNAVSIADFPGYGMGLKATRKISIGEAIVEVPLSCMLHSDLAIGTVLKTAAVCDPILQSMPSVCLAMLLLVEKHKGSDSKWKPYLDMLPRKYIHPLFMTVQEILLLRSSPVFEEAMKLRKNVARQYGYFHQMLLSGRNGFEKLNFTAADFLFDDYCWAICTVMTRQNPIPKSEAGADGTFIISLIPLWDMANHKHGTITTDYDESLKKGICYAMEDNEIGDQVFICYGKRNNGDFVLHNGFICVEHPTDSIKLRLGFSKADKLQERRSAIWESCVPHVPRLEFLLSKNRPHISDELMIFLQLFLADEKQLEHLETQLKNDEYAFTNECFVDKQKCFNYLKNRLQLLLRVYENSNSDVDEGSNECKEMIKQLLQKEKEVLNAVLLSLEK